MKTFAEINWRVWQKPPLGPKPDFDAWDLQALIDETAWPEGHVIAGALRTLVRRIEALEKRQAPAAVVPHIWPTPGKWGYGHLSNIDIQARLS